MPEKKTQKEITIDTTIIERQCDNEYVAQLKDTVNNYDAVLSMACGVGPQFLSEYYTEQQFYPAVNTTFYGGAVSHGIWEERCAGCGTCIIHDFDGLCPVARCAKSLLHGPCGGSSRGMCEISDETLCIWDAIVGKKMEQGRLEDLLNVPSGQRLEIGKGRRPPAQHSRRADFVINKWEFLIL